MSCSPPLRWLPQPDEENPSLLASIITDISQIKNETQKQHKIQTKKYATIYTNTNSHRDLIQRTISLLHNVGPPSSWFIRLRPSFTKPALNSVERGNRNTFSLQRLSPKRS
jgi:hypothetical protein